jgi:FtsZ-interacting cell division protein ZipA
MDMTPILIIASAVVLVALITIALRRTIRHDRAAIKGDMDEPHEIDAYRKNFGS